MYIYKGKNYNSVESVFDLLCEEGVLCSEYRGPGGALFHSSVFKELELLGFALCIGRIPHDPYWMNPSYHFVTNDPRGRQLALEGPEVLEFEGE